MPVEIAKEGATRYVILTGRYAIKIIHIPITRPVHRFFHMENKGFRERLVVTHPNVFMAIIQYFLRGLISNYYEWKLSRKYPDCDLVPTVFTFLWIVNVQRRGQPIAGTDLVQFRFHDHFVRCTAAVRDDVLRQDQMSLFNSRVCLHDYGRSDLEPVLRQLAYYR